MAVADCTGTGVATYTLSMLALLIGSFGRHLQERPAWRCRRPTRPWQCVWWSA